jgi:CheY-like chemotaxis protein
MAQDACEDPRMGGCSEPRLAPVVLLVEDEILIRLDTAERLRARGIAVIEAADAAEALAILESGVKVDIVFTDIRMPGTMDGFGLAGAVRTRRPDIKVIFCSGDELALRGLADGGAIHLADFFRKPYRIEEVEMRIRQLLEAPQ